MHRKQNRKDKLTKEERSLLMGRVRSKNTKPEILVRTLLHGQGYRYRLHRRDLPGSPDIVFPSRKKVIFVHGCFWHRHQGCKSTTTPSTRKKFWEGKFAANVSRDVRNIGALEEKGWKTLVVWGCEIRNSELLSSRLRTFLEGSNRK